MKKLFQISAAAVVLLSASAAFAQIAPTGPAPQGPRLDLSKPAPDMKGITRAQALAHAAARFDEADLNKDGILSRDEMRQARAKHMHEKHMRHPGEKGDGPGDRRGPPPPGGPDGAPPKHGEHGGPRGQGSAPPAPVGEQH
jgi:hypothetical protein